MNCHLQIEGESQPGDRFTCIADYGIVFIGKSFNEQEHRKHLPGNLTQLIVIALDIKATFDKSSICPHLRTAGFLWEFSFSIVRV